MKRLIAKLEFNETTQGDAHTLYVTDSEYTDEPIVELKYTVMTVETALKRNGGFETAESVGLAPNQPVIYVDVVDTLDLNYPDREAAVQKLFLNFAKEYKKDYKDYLLSTEFHNYELQEFVKRMIDKGSVPKDSLKLINQTTEEEYKQDVNYNIGNKEFFANIKNTIMKHHSEQLAEHQYALVNPSKSTIETVIASVSEICQGAAEVVAGFPGLAPDINNIIFEYEPEGNILVNVTGTSLTGETSDGYIGGTFALNDISMVNINGVSSSQDLITQIDVEQFISCMKNSFGDCTLNLGGETISLSDLNQVQVANKTFKRLLKKNSTV